MASDLKTDTTETLRKKVIDLQENLRVARFEGAGSRSRNVRAIRETRRQIARALTELRSRDIEANVAPEAKTA